MASEQDDICRIALSMVPLVGSRRARFLISHFGSAEATLQASYKQLTALPGISSKIAEAVASGRDLEAARQEVNFIRENNIQMLYFMEDEYPDRLKNYDDAPICLFYRGSTPLNGRKHVSVIGTRKPSERGKWQCEKLVNDLSDLDVTIVSGLAYGIDVTAHRASLKAGLPTIGVVAHGLDTIYPAAHKGVARDMISKGGILTEFVRNTRPDRERFPARNRIIAGLCDALVVVESKESGGSMITAHLANDYNKDVFALPGRVDDLASKGCNLLIKQHKAYLMEGAEDLVKMLRWEAKAAVPKQASLFYELNRDGQKIVECINMGVDDINGLCDALQYSHSELSVILLDLEMQSVLRALPGNKYMVLA